MITQWDIAEAICDLAVEKVPELQAAYTGQEPRDTVRPCLLVEAVRTTREDAARRLVRVRTDLTLTIYVEQDGHGRSDPRTLLGLQEQVLLLFDPGHLFVKDRALPVQAGTGGRNWNMAYVDLQLEYLDSRQEERETLPLMETVDTTIAERG